MASPSPAILKQVGLRQPVPFRYPRSSQEAISSLSELAVATSRLLSYPRTQLNDVGIFHGRDKDREVKVRGKVCSASPGERVIHPWLNSEQCSTEELAQPSRTHRSTPHGLTLAPDVSDVVNDANVATCDVDGGARCPSGRAVGSRSDVSTFPSAHTKRQKVEAAPLPGGPARGGWTSDARA